jgi:hypothetical protein
MSRVSARDLLRLIQTKANGKGASENKSRPTQTTVSGAPSTQSLRSLFQAMHVSSPRSDEDTKRRPEPSMSTVDPRLNLRIESLSRVFAECPYVLEPQAKPASAATGRKADKKDLSGNDFYDETENPLAIPERHQLMTEIVSRFPHVNYEQMGMGESKHLTTGEMTIKFREQPYHQIDPCDAFHDNAVLYQAAKRKMKGSDLVVNIPACKYGKECRGFSREITVLSCV